MITESEPADMILASTMPRDSTANWFDLTLDDSDQMMGLHAHPNETGLDGFRQAYSKSIRPSLP